MQGSLTRRAFIHRAGALSLALGAGGALEACGSGSGAGSSATSGTLRVWDFAPTVPTAGTYADSLKRWFAQEYPEVTLKYETQPLANYFAVVTAANAARSGPDVMIVLAGTTGVLSDTFKKVAVPLQSRLGARPLEHISDKQDFSDDAGNLLAAPQSRLGFATYYNKALFEQAGLDPEQPPSTYDALVSAATTLKAKGIMPFAGGNKEGYVGQFFLATMNAGLLTREDMLAHDRGEIPFTDARFVQALASLSDLVRAGYYDKGFPSATLADGVSQFCKGQGAMFGGGEICDSASWRDFDGALGAEKVGVIPGFGIAQPEPFYYPAGGGKGWMITKYARNPQAALKWVQRAISPSQQATLLTGGSYPANTDTSFAQAPEQPQELHDALAGKPTFLAGRQVPPQAGDALRRELAAVLVGDKTPKAALAAVQKARVEAEKR